MRDASYDVVVIGGAFTGACFSTLLARQRPRARILVVERSETFDRKVGEATVEVSAFLLHQVLRLTGLLSRDHLPKHGLRYWFTDGPGRSLAEMSESGPAEPPRLPSFQLDRARLDESLLEMARSHGVEVARPARVTGADLGWPQSRLTLSDGEGERRIRARWVIDATGRFSFLGRRLGLIERNREHPTAAAWGRWRGVADLDATEVAGSVDEPRLAATAAVRRLATNHFCGRGWWCWMIPLADGDTSVGLVWDKRLFAWPDATGNLRDRYLRFVHGHPGLAELLADAELIDGDFRSYAHLPYCSRRYMERGWALIGDAASFIDPFYSPGLDHASISAYATAELVAADLAGDFESEEDLVEAVDEHDATFRRSYRRWFEALYRDKYELFGDAELTTAAFLMDTALYYLGVVRPVYQDPSNLRNPIFGQAIPQNAVAFRTVRAYNRRLVRLARKRRRLGLYGRRNLGWRRPTGAPGLSTLSILRVLASGLALWGRAELATLARGLTGGLRPAKRAAPSGSPASEKVV